MSFETQEPRWEVINNFSDDLDKSITDYFNKEKISYGEIEIGMMMMKEKILQQKIELMHEFLKSKDAETTSGTKTEEAVERPEPKDLYK